MIHKGEGQSIVLSFFILLTNCLPFGSEWLSTLILYILFGLRVQFFRNSDRSIATIYDNLIYAKTDDNTKVLEKKTEDRVIQILFFMNPPNLYASRIPFSADVKHGKYQPDSYLVGMHQKSSHENERKKLVNQVNKYLAQMIQIAGDKTERVCCYFKQMNHV
jgi:phosphatidylserine decarboxylase